MSLTEKMIFVRQLRRDFASIGALIPTSRYAAAAMAAEVARRRGPKRVLEVGAGTGSITAEIVKYLGPDDELVVVEINPEYVAFLQRRFEEEPAFRAVRDRVTIYGMSVTDLPPGAAFDCIVSAVPFTSLPPEVTAAILESYERILKPGGTLTYIEYAYLRAIKSSLSSDAARAKAEAVNGIVDRYIAAYQFRRDVVWRNVPPAWVRHLRLTTAQPTDALDLEPLENHRRVALGDFGVASAGLPFVAGLLALALLGPRGMIRRLLLLLAGVVALFFRDPVRPVRQDPSVAYAACDGRVLSVERLRDERFGPGEWLRVAVFLSLLDVHINRVPVAGKVVEVLHEAGGYAAADKAEAEHNVAQYTVIEGARGRCVVAQRTGLVARRIVNWTQPGQLVAQGERYGLIRFGSRTDIYLPADEAEATVAMGERVVGGVTVVARYRGEVRGKG